MDTFRDAISPTCNKHLLHRDFFNLRYVGNTTHLTLKEFLTDNISYIFNLRPKEGEDIMNHVTALQSMASELNDLGVNVTEHDLITKIMCSLPAQFDFLSSAWDNIPENEKTMRTLRARLVTEQRRINARSAEVLTQPGTSQNNTTNPISGSSNPGTTNTDANSSALYGFGNRGKQLTRPSQRGMRGRGGKTNSHRNAFNGIDRNYAQCTYCGKFRHYEFECRKKSRTKERNKR